MPFRWILDEGQKPDTCIDNLDYASWIRFVFSHPVPRKGGERWYTLGAYDAYHFKDSALFLAHLSQLFDQPESLLASYDIEQIKQGFWCFITAFELPDVLEDRHLGLEPRIDCIQAIPKVYRRLFHRTGFETLAFSYWDPFTHTFRNEVEAPVAADLIPIQEAMFQSLVSILHQDPKICFMSAMRGLCRLRHPRGTEAMQAGLNLRSDLTIHEHAFGLACMRGELDGGQTPVFN